MEQQDDWFFGADGDDAVASGSRAEGGDAEERVAGAGAGGAEDAASSGRRWGRLGVGTAAAAVGVAGLVAVAVSGLGGADVVLASPASTPTGAADPGSVAGTTASEDDAHLASLTAPTGTPEPRPPPAEPVDVPEPEVRVVPLAPGESFDDDAHPWAVAYEIPDVGSTWSSALPSGQVPLGDFGQYRFQPTVPGQSCNGPHPDAVAGRQWSWAEEASNRLDQTTVDLVVTGWPAGGGPEAFADVVEDDGPCTWFDDVPSPTDVAVPSAEEAWAGVRQSPVGDGASVLLGAARTGDLVVGVEVWSPPAEDPEGLLGGLLEAAVLELREDDPGGAAG